MGNRPSGLALPRGNSTPVVGNCCRARACRASIMVVSSSSMGNHRVATHLVVAVTQIDRALRVADQAVQRQPGGVTDAQPGADQDLH